MMNSQVHYLPLAPGFFAILVILFAALIILIQLRILRYAYMRLGVGPGAALLLLFGSLIGSYFNIPITVLPGHTITNGEVVDFYGMRYVVPLVTQWPGTVLAVNIGGAVIPTLMSAYLVIRYQLWVKAAIAVAVIAVVIHAMATPGHTVGHSSFMIQSNGQSLFYTGDVVLHEIMMKNPKVAVSFDTDSDKGVETRMRVLDMLAHDKVQALIFHMAWPGAGHVVKAGSGYRFVPTPVLPVL